MNQEQVDLEAEVREDWHIISDQIRAFQDKWGKPDNDMLFIPHEIDGYFVVAPIFDKDALPLRKR